MKTRIEPWECDRHGHHRHRPGRPQDAHPYGFIAEAGSSVATGRPAGSTPYLGETGMDMKFRDGASGDVLAECRDTEIGRRYAADVNAGATGAARTWVGGYLNSFQPRSYARNAFDKWSELLALRIAQLRGAQTPSTEPRESRRNALLPRSDG